MRELLAYFTSAVFHVALLALFDLAGDLPAVPLPVQQGRASILLMASAPAAATQPDEPAPVEMEVFSVPDEIPVHESPLNEVKPTEAPATERAASEPPRPVLAAESPELIMVVQTPMFEAPVIQREASQAPNETPKVASQTSVTIPRRATAAPQVPVAEPEEIIAEAAVASIASMALEGATTPDATPHKLVNPAPRYPEEAVAANQSGTVILRVLVGADGTVESLRVFKSSGVNSLDDSALAAVRRWRFSPATRGGAAVPGEVNVPIKFRIAR
jgi:protein TonB